MMAPVAVMSLQSRGRALVRAARARAAARAGGDREGQGTWRGWLARPLALWRSQAPISSLMTFATCPPRFADAQRGGACRVLTWTVRSMKDRARAAEHANQIIYEMRSR